MSLPRVTLHPGKEKPLLGGHPWIFSGAIKPGGEPSQTSPGSPVDVVDHRGRFLARGYYNGHSQIRVRVMTRDPNEAIDRALLKRRIAEAASRREPLLEGGRTTVCRIVAHESDRLPGLIVDRYGPWLVFQIVTAGIERLRDDVISVLEELFAPEGIVERSDEKVRGKEGLAERVELVKGSEEGARDVAIRENGLAYRVDLLTGHKTGFYIDQRENRALVGSYANGRTVLNCFSYTGGFSVAAMAGGARAVINVDESAPALTLAERNLELNGFRGETVRDDVFQYLRRLRDEGRKFDLIVMDPPKFVASARQIDRAARGYKDLNLLAFKLLSPGGYLATFSCSGLVSRELFQKIIFGAAVDAGVEAQVLHHLSQAADHPTLLSFPESLYLKGLFCQILP